MPARIQALTARKRAAPAPSSASDALAGGRLKRTWDLLLKRAWDVLPLPELYERYRRNLLTDGVNFLRGDAHIGLFTGSERESATWRPNVKECVESWNATAVEGRMLLMS